MNETNNVTDPIPVLAFIGDWIKIIPILGIEIGSISDLIPIYWRTEIMLKLVPVWKWGHILCD
jgi:hypothetical protein